MPSRSAAVPWFLSALAGAPGAAFAQSPSQGAGQSAPQSAPRSAPAASRSAGPTLVKPVTVTGRPAGVDGLGRRRPAQHPLRGGEPGHGSLDWEIDRKDLLQLQGYAPGRFLTATGYFEPARN